MDVRARATALVRERYADFGPTLACEKLAECHGVLLVYVDDATSRIMVLHFTATESTFSYFEAARAYLELNGKPVAFYSDKASVFRSTQTATTGGKNVTHFGRAMFELNIDGLCANSSQAKGRVERANPRAGMRNMRPRVYSTSCHLLTAKDRFAEFVPAGRMARHAS